MGSFCYRCKHDEKYQQTQDSKYDCDIVTRAMCFSVNDKQYPTEWIADETGPRCTAFEPVEDFEVQGSGDE